MEYNIGIDLGGTNINVGIVDSDYNIVGRGALKTNLPRSEGEIADDIVKAATFACDDAGIAIDEVESIGIGTPGSANRDSGIVIYSSNLGFDNTNLRELLASRFKQMSKSETKAFANIFVENDANAAAYGEMLAGAAKDYDNVVVVTLGTGVGGGIIIDGKIYSGFNYYGAELGHNVIEYGGRPCPCGRNGCLESYASATALIKSTKEAMQKDKNSKLWDICDNIDNVNGKTAFDAMRLGDATGKEVVDEYINYLGCGLVNIINTFQPQMLLIGGGVCKEGDYLTRPLEAIIARESYKVSPDMATKLGVARLGNDAGIIGAAFLYQMSE